MCGGSRLGPRAEPWRKIGIRRDRLTADLHACPGVRSVSRGARFEGSALARPLRRGRTVCRGRTLAESGVGGRASTDQIVGDAALAARGSRPARGSLPTDAHRLLFGRRPAVTSFSAPRTVSRIHDRSCPRSMSGTWEAGAADAGKSRTFRVRRAASVGRPNVKAGGEPACKPSSVPRPNRLTRSIGPPRRRSSISATGCPAALAADPRTGQRDLFRPNARFPGRSNRVLLFGLAPSRVCRVSLPVRVAPARARLCGTGPRLAADGRYPLPCAEELGLSSRPQPEGAVSRSSSRLAEAGL